MRFGPAAMKYAELGWAVLPVVSHGKIPLTPHGVHDATKGIEMIEQWARAFPDANVGLACGTSGFFVVDVDPRSGGDETLAELEREHGALRPNVIALTGGGGFHYLFRLRPDIRLRGTIGPGIDIKAHGGFIVAPPSRHPSGRIYRWDSGAHPLDAEPGDPPDWLLRLVLDGPKKAYAPGSGSSSESFLGVGLATDGRLGRELVEGKVAIMCPWLDQHSPDRFGVMTGDGNDSSTALLPPSPNVRLGRFSCLHGHCVHRRVRDVLLTLSPRAMDAARMKYPDAFRVAVRILSTKEATR